MYMILQYTIRYYMLFVNWVERSKTIQLINLMDLQRIILKFGFYNDVSKHKSTLRNT